MTAAALRVLMLLRRRPAISWSASEVAGELSMTEDEAGLVLFDLMARGYLTLSRYVPPRYQYDPPATSRPTIDRLARLYAASPDVLLELVQTRSDVAS